MNKRQKRARTQPKDGRQATGGGAGALFNPVGVQLPYQKLFQAPPNEVRSLTMSSANANEASNNVSALIDKSQQISEGRILSFVKNALLFNTYKRLEESEAMKQQSGVSISEYDDDDNEDMPKIKTEPVFKEKKIDTTPIDLTVDEPLYEDMGIGNVVVEDVVEKKDDMIAPVDRMQEKIKPPTSGKKPPRAKGTEEQKKKANERYLRDKAVREAKKKSLLLDEYGINE